jgi:hypothetical protein
MLEKHFCVKEGYCMLISLAFITGKNSYKIFKFRAQNFHEAENISWAVRRGNLIVSFHKSLLRILSEVFEIVLLVSRLFHSLQI